MVGGGVVAKSVAWLEGWVEGGVAGRGGGGGGWLEEGGMAGGTWLIRISA